MFKREYIGCTTSQHGVSSNKRGGGFETYSAVEIVQMRLGGTRLGCYRKKEKKIKERSNRWEGEKIEKSVGKKCEEVISLQ